VKKVLLLTGKPGTGKTAIIKEAIAKTKLKAGGFYTEEIRVDGIRQGFRIISLDGREAILAHINISSPYHISKYKIDIESLNKVGVPAIHRASKECDLVVIDEIGKMELLSPQFREAMLQAINNGKKVLGTIMLNSQPLVDEIKCHPEVKVLLVINSNRNQVLKEIMNWLETTSDENHA